MKRTCLLLCIFILSAISSNSQNWIRQNTYATTSIEFPGLPERVDTMGMSSYRYITDSALYIVQIRGIRGSNILSQHSDSLPAFYHGVIEGIIERSNGTLIESKEFQINGFIGVEIKVGGISLSPMPDLQYARLIIKDDIFFYYTFWTSSQNDSILQSQRLRYFNSIKFQDN